MSPTTTALDVQHQGHRVQLTLRRPASRNAFDAALIADLRHTFEQLQHDRELRVVVLAAEGPLFCAGADLNWMRTMADANAEDNLHDARALADMLHAIDQCPVPVLAAVQGDCYGGGVGLVAACDVVVATPEAGFCLSEVRLGLIPATISPYVIRAMGERACRRYMVSAERFTAEQAQSMGLVHELCAATGLRERVAQLAALVESHGPQAVRATKRLVRDVSAQPSADSWREDTAQRIAAIRASDEGREGVAAFLARRPPAWRAPIHGNDNSED